MVDEEMVSIPKKEYDLLMRLKEIYYHSQPEKTGSYFICGKGGDVDEFGLPDTLLVCPAMGLSGFAAYTKTADFKGSGW